MDIPEPDIIALLRRRAGKRLTLTAVLHGLNIDWTNWDNRASGIHTITRLLDQGKIQEEWSGDTPRERVYFVAARAAHG